MGRAISRLVLMAPSMSAVALHGGEQGVAKRLRTMGAHVFLDPETGEIREVNLNGAAQVGGATLTPVARFPDLTDLFRIFWASDSEPPREEGKRESLRAISPAPGGGG